MTHLIIKLVCAAFLFLPLQARADAPERIVSLNLCADIYLLMLARPGTVKSVSFLAKDTSLSPVAQKAAPLHANTGNVETLVRFDPDLVFAHAYTSPLKIAFFEKIGVPVVKIADPRSFEDIRENLRKTARALGREEAGEKAIAAFDEKLAAAAYDGRSPRPRVVIYRPRGLAEGNGGLTGALLGHVGMQNIAAGRGTGMASHMPLEEILLAAPDYMIVSADALQDRSMVRALLDHKAIRYFDKAHDGQGRIAIPSDLWSCGTPFIADVARKLGELVGKGQAGS